MTTTQHGHWTCRYCGAKRYVALGTEHWACPADINPSEDGERWQCEPVTDGDRMTLANGTAADKRVTLGRGGRKKR